MSKKNLTTRTTIENLAAELKKKFEAIAAQVELALKSGKVEEATAGNFAGLDENGNLTDSGKKPGDFVEKVMVDGEEDVVIHASDISDYTSEEIAAMLNGSETVK